MSYKQLSLFTDTRSENCPFGELLEPDDNKCFSQGLHSGYDFISEDHPDFAQWMADVRGVGFDDVIAKPSKKIDLPLYIPSITVGSRSLLQGTGIKFFAVSLRDVVSPVRLSMAIDIRARLGLEPDSKLLLMNYAEDALIEKIWPIRMQIFPELAKLGFDLVTSINYSIWLDQPHPERLINTKRNLLTYSELQSFGMNTIPHIYWSGKKDLERWAVWLNNNPSVWCIAINLQTEREYRSGLWGETIEDLGFFIPLLKSAPHVLVTGASTLPRVQQLREIIPSISVSNGVCARRAASGYLLSEKDGKLLETHHDIPKNEILKKNIQFFDYLMTRPIHAH